LEKLYGPLKNENASNVLKIIIEEEKLDDQNIV
jgi:hypothetical protein